MPRNLAPEYSIWRGCDIDLDYQFLLFIARFAPLIAFVLDYHAIDNLLDDINHVSQYIPCKDSDIIFYLTNV